MSAPGRQEEIAMAKEARTDLQKAEKAGMTSVPEQTRPGAVYSPSVDIFENDDAITVLADMPGVKAQDLEIDLRERMLTLTARATLPDSSREWDVLREYESGTFFRQFTLSETIDQAKIDARLADGVLRLELPKVEKARPRKISVRTD
jgi:HSP20 family molecular chaperone IbpA